MTSSSWEETLDDSTHRLEQARPSFDGARLRMTYRAAERYLGVAIDVGARHDLRPSLLTHAREDGLTEADRMKIFGRKDRRTFQQCRGPSKEFIQLRPADVQRGPWTPSAGELAARMAKR